MTQSNNQSSSRRDFLKVTTATAVGTSILSTLGSSAHVYANGDDKIKVGLVGCGGRGTGAASQALSTKGNIKLEAMADAYRDRMDKSLSNLQKQFSGEPEKVDVAEEKKFVGFDAYQKLLDSGVDVVILATPPGFRPIHFEAAVEKGKHVFMEKPVATDVPGVRKVLEAAEKAKEKKLAVGVGLQRHHQANYIETINRLKDGAIGDITSMRCYWNSGGVWEPRLAREDAKSEMDYQMRNWYYYNWLCGDHINEQHIHNIDVCNWVKDAFPVQAYGLGGRQVRTDKKYGEIYDHFAVEFVYEDGTRLYSQCRHIRNCWNSVTEHAQGTKGFCDISGAKYETTGGYKWRYRGKKTNPYQVEHDDLFAAIRQGTPYNEAEYGAKSTMTSILGRLATYSGKPVTWDEAMASNVSLMPKEFSWEGQPVTVPDENGYYPIPMPGISKVL